MDRDAFEPRALMADIAICVGFYTRLPAPSPADAGHGFAAAQWAAPVAGALVGLVCGLAVWLALWLGLPPQIAAIAALAAGMVLTGALHEDGAADVADGFGGGRDRDEKLAIMRDSRIGTYGTLTLIVGALARWAALCALAAGGAGGALLALVAAHAASRALIPAFMMRVPAARADGLSAGAGMVESRTALAALAIGGVALISGGIGFAIATALVLAAWFLLLERLCRREIGGQTGDVLGALQQGGEIAVLCIAAACLV